MIKLSKPPKKWGGGVRLDEKKNREKQTDIKYVKAVYLNPNIKALRELDSFKINLEEEIRSNQTRVDYDELVFVKQSIHNKTITA